jgi:hypothetical protein
VVAAVAFGATLCLLGCAAAPSSVPALSEDQLAAYAATPISHDTGDIAFRLVGLRLPSRGVVVDVLVEGPENAGMCAARIAELISLARNPGRYVQIVQDGRVVALGPEKRPSEAPWVRVDYGAPPQQDVRRASGRVAVLQTLLLSGSLDARSCRVRFAPGTREALLGISTTGTGVRSAQRVLG